MASIIDIALAIPYSTSMDKTALAFLRNYYSNSALQGLFALKHIYFGANSSVSIDTVLNQLNLQLNDPYYQGKEKVIEEVSLTSADSTTLNISLVSGTSYTVTFCKDVDYSNMFQNADYPTKIVLSFLSSGINADPGGVLDACISKGASFAYDCGYNNRYSTTYRNYYTPNTNQTIVKNNIKGSIKNYFSEQVTEPILSVVDALYAVKEVSFVRARDLNSYKFTVASTANTTDNVLGYIIPSLNGKVKSDELDIPLDRQEFITCYGTTSSVLDSDTLTGKLKGLAGFDEPNYICSTKCLGKEQGIFKFEVIDKYNFYFIVYYDPYYTHAAAIANFLIHSRDF